jgi:hypothetical protein
VNLKGALVDMLLKIFKSLRFQTYFIHFYKSCSLADDKAASIEGTKQFFTGFNFLRTDREFCHQGRDTEIAQKI